MPDSAATNAGPGVQLAVECDVILEVGLMRVAPEIVELVTEILEAKACLHEHTKIH